MAEINLLPWRENLRHAARKEFLLLFMVILGLVGAILIIVFNMLNTKIRHQQARNNELQQNIDTLESKIAAITAIKLELNNLNTQQTALEKLQLQNREIVSFLQQIAAQIPPALYLTRLDKKGVQFTFEGMAESNARVSEFMQKIANIPGMIELNLAEIKAVDNKGYYFKITVQKR